MAYDEKLAGRVRAFLTNQKNVAEKRMMGGLAFMVNGKMCVGIVKKDLMARIDPDVYEEALRRSGCREMDFTGKPLKGFVFVDPGGIKTDEMLRDWIGLALAFNGKAKSSKKPKRK